MKNINIQKEEIIGLGNLLFKSTSKEEKCCIKELLIDDAKRIKKKYKITDTISNGGIMLYRCLDSLNFNNKKIICRLPNISNNNNLLKNSYNNKASNSNLNKIQNTETSNVSKKTKNKNTSKNNLNTNKNLASNRNLNVVTNDCNNASDELNEFIIKKNKDIIFKENVFSNILNYKNKNKYIVNLSEIIKKPDYIYYVYDDVKYNLNDILMFNSSGLDILLIRSIVYQLLKAVELFNKNNLTYFNINPCNILIEIIRHKQQLIGFNNEAMFLSSNTYTQDHDLYIKLKLFNFLNVTYNKKLKLENIDEDILETQSSKNVKKDKNKDKNKKKEEDSKKKKQVNNKNKDKEPENNNNNIIIEELKRDVNYKFNKYYPPEYYIKNIFKNSVNFEELESEYMSSKEEFSNNKQTKDKTKKNQSNAKLNEVNSIELNYKEFTNLNGTELDIWGIGCVIAEIIDGNSFIPEVVSNDLECLSVINSIVGLTSTQKHICSENDVLIDIKEFKHINTIYLNNKNNSKVDLKTNIEQRYLGKASKELIDLLKKMLEPNPFKRINLIESFNHPFLRSYYDINAIPNNYSVCKTKLPKLPVELVDSHMKKLSEYDKNIAILKNLIVEKDFYKPAINNNSDLCKINKRVSLKNI